MGKSFDRIGVTFDRYRKDSIKSGTKKKQTQWQHAHKKSKTIGLTLLHYRREQNKSSSI